MLKIFLVIMRLWFGHTVETEPSTALAQAWVESRYDPYAVSRVVDGRRKTGHWSESFPSSFHGPFFCGLWQTEALTETECQAQQHLVYAYFVRRAELRAWLVRQHGNVTQALDGYGCGTQGADTEICNDYAGRVMRLAAYFARGIGS